MTRLVELWLPLLIGACGLVPLAFGLRKYSKGGLSGAFSWLLIGGLLTAAGIGGLALGAEVGQWIAIVALIILAAKLGALFFTGHWYYRPASALGMLAVFGLGGWVLRDVSSGVTFGVRTLLSSEVAQPWWLLLLALIPLVIWMSFRSLAGLGPVRRWLAIGLRCLLILLLTLALAELRLRRPNDTTTVLFVVDRSLSIPQEIDPAEATPVDRRWQRMKRFMTEAVSKRGTGHERDQAGLVVFGRRPRLVLPAAAVDRLVIDDSILGGVDTSYTDIAAAIKLALASFPEGSAKRIVLLSDGNENLGNSLEQARLAQQNGVQIDVVPLATGYRNENEVLVEKVEAPPTTEQGARLPIRVLIRSYNPRAVVGTLGLRQLSEGSATVPVAIEAGPGVRERGPPAVVQLRPGLNSFSFKQSLEAKQQSYTYEAVFTPIESVNDRSELVRGLAGDRVQNNSASTHVVALGRRRVLFVEGRDRPNEHDHLIRELQGQGDTKFHITKAVSSELPNNAAELGVFLSNFDCLVLANVPSDELNDEQQEMIRSNTHDQGCGLVMIGGHESFGAGGYQGTPVEKALPVDCDIKSIKVAGKGGLVLIMHASEMDSGNALQKQVAKLAVQKLAAADMVGLIQYGIGSTVWHIPFQTVGTSRNALLRQVDRMQPMDMPEFDTGLQMAYKELTNPNYNLATKHVIIISDGDPQLTNQAFLTTMRQAGVTVSTVGVATHGAPENQKMTQIATTTGGKAHFPTNPRAIPQIYVREVRLVSQSFLYEQRFAPRLQVASGPSDKLTGTLPALHGFVRTSLKQSPLVEMGIEGPPTLDQRFPILASWQYGLGKAVAFTSDAKSAGERLGWDREWAGSDMYLKFWEQMIGWALRGVETGKMALSTEYRDGKVRVTVDARDDRNRPMTDLRLQGLVTAPNQQPGEAKPITLKFEQKNSGQYEAEFRAEEAGSYFINANAARTVTQIRNGQPVQVDETDSIRSGVTLPYSPEFADLESNTALLRRLSETTGGNVYAEDDGGLADVVRSGSVFRKTTATAQSPQPMWYWLVLIAGLVLFFDVAVRRIALDPTEAATAATKAWDKLRGKADTSAAVPVFLERLKSRKAAVGESLEREKSTRRFDAGAEAPPVAPITTADAATRPAPPPRPQPRPQVPATSGEGNDPFARLMKAKRKALEDRDQKPDDPGSANH